MNKPSDAPLVLASINAYEQMQQTLEAMRQKTSDLAELLAIAAVADEVNVRIGALRAKARKLSVGIKAALS